MFKRYFDKHAPLFVDAPIKEQGGEQDLEYYELFQEYLGLYESTMAAYIEGMDASVEDFYCQMQDVQEDKNIKDKKLVHFVNYMIGSVDYPAFYKMMVRAGDTVLLAWQMPRRVRERQGQSGRGVGLSNVDEVADSKGGDSKGGDSGAGGKGA